MITRVPKKKENEEQQMFETPTAEIFRDVDNEEGKNEIVDDKYDTLAKQLADLQTRLSESEKANMALLVQPQWRSQTTETYTEVKPETVALPDPALDPDGYDRATGERNRIRWENQQRKADFDNRQRQSVQEKVDNLWEAFGDKYPDMVKDKERVEFVSTQVAKDAQRRGIDVERYMFLTQDKFLDDVARKFVSVFGEPEGEDDRDDFEDNQSGRRTPASSTSRRRASNRRREEDDDMVSRTGGIFGGNESGGRPSRGRDADEEQGPSMIDDIQALQRKTGFF